MKRDKKVKEIKERDDRDGDKKRKEKWGRRKR